MTNLEMAKQPTDMGFDVDLDTENGKFNSMLIAEIATNKGYKWSYVTKSWLTENEENKAPFKCPLCEAGGMEYKEVNKEKGVA